VEARDGIEPPNKGFAGLSLNIWVPRRQCTYGTNIYRLERAKRTSCGSNAVERNRRQTQIVMDMQASVETDDRPNLWGIPANSPKQKGSGRPLVGGRPIG
jgi:hypothetical protein